MGIYNDCEILIFIMGVLVKHTIRFMKQSLDDTL